MKLILGLALMHFSMVMAQDCTEECYYAGDYESEACDTICAANGNEYATFNDYCFCLRCDNTKDSHFYREKTQLNYEKATVPACSYEGMAGEGEECMMYCPDNTFWVMDYKGHCYCFYHFDDGQNTTTTSSTSTSSSTTVTPTSTTAAPTTADTNSSGKSGLLVPMVSLWLAIWTLTYTN